ncbi:hypothetical protein CaCOL14_003611 [Colletotrichum acutatum]
MMPSFWLTVFFAINYVFNGVIGQGTAYNVPPMAYQGCALILCIWHESGACRLVCWYDDFYDLYLVFIVLFVDFVLQRHYLIYLIDFILFVYLIVINIILNRLYLVYLVLVYFIGIHHHNLITHIFPFYHVYLIFILFVNIRHFFFFNTNLIIVFLVLDRCHLCNFYLAYVFLDSIFDISLLYFFHVNIGSIADFIFINIHLLLLQYYFFRHLIYKFA